MEKWRAFRNSPRYEDAKGGVVKKGKNLLMTILQIILIVGISYVILSPVIGIVAQSFFSDADSANPMVYTIPIEGTLERYTTVITQMDYFRTLGNTLIYTVALTLIQVLICSMVGYGFARFDFPLKKLLFGCVVLMIVIPNHTIMLPQYMTFRSMGLMSEATPMYILTLFGTGLRAGLFIYIFNQFFRGLPKEIEEAAFVDGAGNVVHLLPHHACQRHARCHHGDGILAGLAVHGFLLQPAVPHSNGHAAGEAPIHAAEQHLREPQNHECPHPAAVC